MDGRELLNLDTHHFTGVYLWNVYQHPELLKCGETCPYGGGLWKREEGRRCILLFGRSFAFGAPEFSQVRRIEWSGLGGSPQPLFHLPLWPSEEGMVPVYVQ